MDSSVLQHDESLSNSCVPGEFYPITVPRVFPHSAFDATFPHVPFN